MNQNLENWENQTFSKTNNETEKGMPFRATEEWWKLSDIWCYSFDSSKISAIVSLLEIIFISLSEVQSWTTGGLLYFYYLQTIYSTRFWFKSRRSLFHNSKLPTQRLFPPMQAEACKQHYLWAKKICPSPNKM